MHPNCDSLQLLVRFVNHKNLHKPSGQGTDSGARRSW
ncbi:hypothetical protein E2C01_053575 [Portunus trituberculatus]|uniref:Uncharacterized protein n=1 Tax=Portunus trituberculatus TaxID=210409 RepID=A0A5B7GHH8_PORTR|nr:hypothetical protein [Portunus trituberculatus]